MNVRTSMLAVLAAIIFSGCSDDSPDTGSAMDPASVDDAGAGEADGPRRDSGPRVVPDLCGDGIQGPTEQCDDGNEVSGDGCTLTCLLEPGWECRPGQFCALSVVCGDGRIGVGELCDDGNAASGDGCSMDCRSLETAFVCPMPGEPCVSTMLCGDGKITGSELCDDANVFAGDGCAADCRAIESGWGCPVPGARCKAAACGDGLRAADEQCDDGNQAAADGCSDHCQIEAGWVCNLGEACRRTTCGDAIVEGSEQCDDNALPFDGCYKCQSEPLCNNDGCTAVCGDGIVFPGEQCDDGNTRANDGCSPTCTPEPGYACTTQTDAAPQSITIPLIYRDFRGRDLAADPANGLPAGHPDFQLDPVNDDRGIVGGLLGANKKPVYAPAMSSRTTTGSAAFAQWYTDVDRVNISIADTLTLPRLPDGSYRFDDQDFFPLDGRGFMDPSRAAEPTTRFGGHNFHFTSELRYWFEYKGGEKLDFRGDDDVWVFVNGRLAVDLGGIHPPEDGSVTLGGPSTTFGMLPGRIYEIVVFQAERHVFQSSYKLTLRGFEKKRTSCVPACGDGVRTPDEVCDDGAANNAGGYGQCRPDCQGYGPRCGDGVTQPESGEQCDNGVNLGGYGDAGCSPMCKRGAVCGDAMVDGIFGEHCDDGANDGGYNECAPGCKLGERCGDGIKQASEQCDDGNTIWSDGCDNGCRLAEVVI